MYYLCLLLYLLLTCSCEYLENYLDVMTHSISSGCTGLFFGTTWIWNNYRHLSTSISKWSNITYSAKRPWCDITVLNVHALTEDKSGDSKNSFYKPSYPVCDHVCKYYIIILLWESKAKLGRKDLFTPTMGTIQISNGQEHDVPTLNHS